MHRKGKSKEDADEESGMKIKTVDGESESGDDYEPNLDWLPDPDKIYGRKEESGDEAEVADNTTGRKTPKRKLKDTKSNFKLKKKKSTRASADDYELDGKLMEELALKLLNK